MGGNFNPGAARFGNFINYYQFNPAEKRLVHLPENLAEIIQKTNGKTESDQALLCLDIGCNTGVSLNINLYFIILP